MVEQARPGERSHGIGLTEMTRATCSGLSAALVRNRRRLHPMTIFSYLCLLSPSRHASPREYPFDFDSGSFLKALPS